MEDFLNLKYKAIKRLFRDLNEYNTRLNNISWQPSTQIIIVWD